MARILLVDDDGSMLDALSMAVTDAGHTAITAEDGVRALERAEKERPDAIVSDINMPSLDGFTLCRRLRSAQNRVPIILVTSRDTEVDEALGLELGADDYITKPFSTRILLARITALLRRDAFRTQSDVGGAGADAVVAGSLTLDTERLEAAYAGVVLTLTLSEFRLLEAFARRPGVVISRDRLLEIVRGDDSVVGDRIIDTYVRRLRRKLEAVDESFADIETVVGAGYRLRGR